MVVFMARDMVSWDVMGCHGQFQRCSLLKSLERRGTAEDLEPATPESWSSQLAKFSVIRCAAKRLNEVRRFGAERFVTSRSRFDMSKLWILRL